MNGKRERERENSKLITNEYSLRNYGLAFMINTYIFIKKIKKEGILFFIFAMMLKAAVTAIFNMFTFLNTQGTF